MGIFHLSLQLVTRLKRKKKSACYRNERRSALLGTCTRAPHDASPEALRGCASVQGDLGRAVGLANTHTLVLKPGTAPVSLEPLFTDCAGVWMCPERARTRPFIPVGCYQGRGSVAGRVPLCWRVLLSASPALGLGEL